MNTHYNTHSAPVNSLLYADMTMVNDINIKATWSLHCGILAQRIRYLTNRYKNKCIVIDGIIYCRLTDDQVAKLVRCSRRKVQHIKHRMVKIGHIKIVHAKDDYATLYALTEEGTVAISKHPSTPHETDKNMPRMVGKKCQEIKESLPNGREKKYKQKKISPDEKKGSRNSEDQTHPFTELEQKVTQLITEHVLEPNGLTAQDSAYWRTHVANFIGYFEGDLSRIASYLKVAKRCQFLNPYVAKRHGFKGAPTFPSPFTFLKLATVERVLAGGYNPVDAPPILDDSEEKLRKDMVEYLHAMGEQPYGDSVDTLTHQTFETRLKKSKTKEDKIVVKDLKDVEKYSSDEQMTMVKRHIFASRGTPITYAVRRFFLNTYGTLGYAQLVGHSRVRIDLDGTIVCKNDFVLKQLQMYAPEAVEKYGARVEGKGMREDVTEVTEPLAQECDFDALLKLCKSGEPAFLMHRRF